MFFDNLATTISHIEGWYGFHQLIYHNKPNRIYLKHGGRAGELYMDGLAQDCSNSSALAMELQQSCTGPSISGPPSHHTI